MKTETLVFPTVLTKENVSKGLGYRGGERHLRGFEVKQAPNTLFIGVRLQNASWVTFVRAGVMHEAAQTSQPNGVEAAPAGSSTALQDPRTSRPSGKHDQGAFTARLDESLPLSSFLFTAFIFGK